MADPVLLIVSGLPATGKTTLAKRLAAQFALPLMHKDEMKETLSDILGNNSIEESRRLGYASMVLLYRFAETLLSVRQPCLIESYFHPDLARHDLLDIQQRCPFFPLQVHCHTELSISIKRYQERFATGLRHPGHRDAEHLQLIDETNPTQLQFQQAIPIEGQTIELDTTDFAAIDYDALYSQIAEVLKRSKATEM